jgi:NAD(P)-dependent dehydrogenase (short-subunit alcohol dehydrogenase family)
LKLSGKVAIVTGTGGGIGCAAALSLPMRGVALVIVGPSREKLAETAQLVQVYTPAGRGGQSHAVFDAIDGRAQAKLTKRD